IQFCLKVLLRCIFGAEFYGADFAMFYCFFHVASCAKIIAKLLLLHQQFGDIVRTKAAQHLINAFQFLAV
ncbi:MAG: hypothetical protein UDP13_01745, partial [Butyricicoccus sp.]|nr:hypothetical protein [Butyricicoccus sp.]